MPKDEFITRKITLNGHKVEIIEPTTTISFREFEKEMKSILRGFPNDIRKTEKNF